MHTHTITRSLIAVAIGAVLVAGAFFAGSKDTASEDAQGSTALAGAEVTFYRSPTCGCCAGHAAALEAAGADVDMQNIDGEQLQKIKEEKGIPFNKQSCHTALIDGYVVEGHVPLAALEKLLTERPNIAGITLPGMPIGTPGMPGPQTEPYIVETLGGEEFWRKDPS